MAAPRCVVVERPTEYQELLLRHGTREQVRFFLEQRGESLAAAEARHELQRRHHGEVMGAVPVEWRRAGVQRADLDRFLFEPEDIVVVLGQDGLVANVAKYLQDEQPVIGLNPDPQRYLGVLVRHDPAAAEDLMHDVAVGRASVERRTMARAALDDGQELLALNEVFVGHASHQSARYRIGLGAVSERQSSSGVVVATGTGATGWAASLRLERHSTLDLPQPEQRGLAFFVREPWPSPATGTELTEGLLGEDQTLTLVCELGDGGVVFGDGIEADHLRLEWGQRVEVAVAARALRLVH
jgi:NAD kinase